MLRRFFKKTEGAISLFLAIIMLANFALSAVVVEGARWRMAKSMVQEAADSAIMSVLAKYDMDLYDRYGLFALENKDVYDDFQKFFLANLSAQLPEGDTMDKLFEELENKYHVQDEVGVNFDLYDFKLESEGKSKKNNRLLTRYFTSEPCEENGFKKFDYEKFCSMVLFFAYNNHELLKTKLMKLLKTRSIMMKLL